MEFHLNILKARMENAYQKILVRENSWAKDLTQDNEHPQENNMQIDKELFFGFVVTVAVIIIYFIVRIA